MELSAEEDARSRGRSFRSRRELFSSCPLPDPFQKVVVGATDELRVGLVVDQVIGDHRPSLSRQHADVETFSGPPFLATAPSPSSSTLAW